MSEVTLTSSRIGEHGREEEVMEKSGQICFSTFIRFLLFLDVGKGGSQLILEFLFRLVIEECFGGTI